MVPDDLEHLRRAEAVNEDVLRHLRHVAAVGCLVPDNIDVRERATHGVVVLHVPLAKLGRWIDPCWLAELVGVRFKIIEDANGPAFAKEEIDDVRADETRASGDERALLVGCHGVLRASG